MVVFTQWPLFFLLHFTGVEPFVPPSSDFLLICFIGWLVISLLSLIMLVALALNSPLFNSLGQILSMPASILADWLLYGFLLPPLAFLGIGLVAVGFVLFNIAEWLLRKKEAKEKMLLEDQRRLLDYEEGLIL